MIMRKFWITRNALGGVKYRYEGWFLFGFIPLYLVRMP